MKIKLPIKQKFIYNNSYNKSIYSIYLFILTLFVIIIYMFL